MTQNEHTVADDVLSGAAAIARFTGDNKRRVDYLLQTGMLPAGQIGRIWVASKQRLREHYARITAGERV